MNESELLALRATIYARPSVRPGCVRAHDETWDLIDPDECSLREIEPGHWHVVAGRNLCGWGCTGAGRGGGCLSWSDVCARFSVDPAAAAPPKTAPTSS